MGTISNCHTIVNVSGDWIFGGRIVYNTGDLNSCSSEGIIIGTEGEIGGLAGRNYKSIRNCHFSGNVSGDETLGGLIGNNEKKKKGEKKGTISNCYSTGSLYGNNIIGGFIKNNRGTISNCYSIGHLTGNSNGGGFAGMNYNTDHRQFLGYWNFRTELEQRRNWEDHPGDEEAQDIYLMPVGISPTDGVSSMRNHTPFSDGRMENLPSPTQATIVQSTRIPFSHSTEAQVSDDMGIVNWTWTFNDNGMIYLYGIKRKCEFNDPGSFIVTLNVTDAVGKWDLDAMNLTVRDITKPVAEAGPDQQIDEDNVIAFDGSGSSDNVGIVNWTWTFLDGDRITLHGIKPEYSFHNPGMFIVTRKATDATGNWNLDSLNITVSDTTSPIADAGPDQTVNQGTIVIFNGSASYYNDEISNWTWTFRDGNQYLFHGMRPNYRFNVPGVYVVTLNVRDPSGLLNADMMKITVLDITPPIALMQDPIELLMRRRGCPFYGSQASSDNIGIVNWTWVFLDEELITLTGSEPAQSTSSNRAFIWSQ